MSIPLQISQVQFPDCPIWRKQHQDIARWDFVMQHLDLIASAIRSIGHKTAVTQYLPDGDLLTVTAAGKERPALNEAADVLGAPLLLHAMYKCGTPTDAVALQMSETQLTPEDKDILDGIRWIMVQSGYLKN